MTDRVEQDGAYASLPAADSTRWKPLRAGLVDVFYYDVEEFHFHDGRLLLRGNNGTGKSKVLAMTLPFLLDGDLSPHRVEPDGDRQKRMEWNLLLGGKHPHPERIGYTWMEFGRRAPDGTVAYRTIGCGMKAVRDRGIQRHWFFVTPQRVGGELALVGPSRVALTRDRLRDAVEGRGMVYDRAADYRRAVDEALFGLGERRYGALINLLIQLRRPQLSEKPDERRLSEALTEALPPVGEDLLRTVADAFRGLDEDREQLEHLRAAEQAATAFLRHYRHYARVAAKRQAEEPRSAQNNYEQLGERLAAAEADERAAEAAVRTASTRIGELDDERQRLEARRDALRESPEMDQALELERTGQRLAELRDLARTLEGRRETLEQRSREQQRVADEAGQREQGDEETFARAAERAADAAERGRFGAEHRAIAQRWEANLDAARQESRDLLGRRDSALRRLDALLRAVEQAQVAVRRAQEDVDRHTARLEEYAELIDASERAIHDEAAALAAAYRARLGEATELRVPDPASVLTELESWARNVDGPNPGEQAVREAERRGAEELARQRYEHEAERDECDRGRGEVTARIERLEAGGHEEPPAPYTRDPEARTGRAGAPFWRVVDFAPDLPEDGRAGLEAALEASGILDAWLSPDGSLHGADDVLLSVGRGGLAADTGAGGATCAAALVPAIDPEDPHAAALSEELVGAALGAIGLGDDAGTDAWVTPDGRWGVGVLTGSWHKSEAQFVGEGAREQARRAQLAQLRAELAELTERYGRAVAALEENAERRDRLAAEAVPPSDAELRQAHTTLVERRRSRELQRSALETARETLRAREGERDRAREAAEEFAGDVGLPTDPEELTGITEATREYGNALEALWPLATTLLRAREATRTARAELERVGAELVEETQGAEQAERDAAAAEERYRTLQETVGSRVEQLNRQLDEVRTSLARCEENRRNADDALGDAKQQLGGAQRRREELQEQRSEAEEERRRAVARFQQFVATGLVAVALPEVEVPDEIGELAMTPVVALARTVHREVEDVDGSDAAWERAQKKFTEEHKVLSDAMARHGHDVGMSPHADVMVVDVLFQGRRREIAELTGALREDLEQREELLSARERRILENHLLNEVAGTLQELVSAADDEVFRMNEELKSRPTSTGMRLRLRWRPARDAPEGLEHVRRQLRQTVDAWSEEDRLAVGTFLQERIDREHQENPAVGRAEQLARALDYRRWYEFVIERYQDGQWRSAAGPASGGERALVASVPLFAAASAHYQSADNRHAPRLVALDEAFAGVDDDSRAKCLGLLATFDMDVVMTSEREWGCYPEVPGLGISHLARREGIDAVLVTPWRWDGRERRRVRRADAMLASVESSGNVDEGAGATQEGLFG